MAVRSQYSTIQLGMGNTTFNIDMLIYQYKYYNNIKILDAHVPLSMHITATKSKFFSYWQRQLLKVGEHVEMMHATQTILYNLSIVLENYTL